LKPGVITTWPFASHANTRGTLLLDQQPAPTQFTLSGIRLLINTSTIKTIAMDVGSFAVTIQDSQGVTRSATLDILPGAEQSLAQLFRVPEPPTGRPIPAIVESPQPIGRSTFWPWIIIGGGAAVAGAGTGIALMGYGEAGKATSPTTKGNLVLNSTQVSAQQQVDDAKQTVGIGYAVLGVGAALTIGGLAWLLSQPEESTADAMQAPPRPGLWVSPTGNGFVFGGAF
jgi:hypothetical protein